MLFIKYNHMFNKNKDDNKVLSEIILVFDDIINILSFIKKEKIKAEKNKISDREFEKNIENEIKELFAISVFFDDGIGLFLEEYDNNNSYEKSKIIKNIFDILSDFTLDFVTEVNSHEEISLKYINEYIEEIEKEKQVFFSKWTEK